MEITGVGKGEYIDGVRFAQSVLFAPYQFYVFQLSQLGGDLVMRPSKQLPQGLVCVINVHLLEFIFPIVLDGKPHALQKDSVQQLRTIRELFVVLINEEYFRQLHELIFPTLPPVSAFVC